MKVEVSDSFLSEPMNQAALHQVIEAYFSNARIDTSSQKNRSQVRGGGKKPWRQKGTGRARAGTIRSPLFRGGGMIFAKSSSKNYKKKVNRKLFSKVVRIIFSDLFRQNRLLIVDEVSVDRPKTSEFVSYLKKFSVDSCVVLVSEIQENILYASRNLPRVKLSTPSSIKFAEFDFLRKGFGYRGCFEKIRGII